MRASSTRIRSILGSGTRFLGILGFKYPKIYGKRVRVVSNWPENFQVNSEHNFNTCKNPKVEGQRYYIDKTFKVGQFRIGILGHKSTV